MRLRESRTDSCPPDRVSPGWKIECLEKGRSISRLWIVDRVMRIGGATVRVGGISTVGTDKKYRGHGLASQVMHAALALMEREGYDASVLHGIPDFYHRFGYVSCIPEYDLILPAGFPTPLKGGGKPKDTDGHRLKLRALHPDDLPAMARMYNRENATRTGSIFRNPRTWKGFPRSAGFFMNNTMR